VTRTRDRISRLFTEIDCVINILLLALLNRVLIFTSLYTAAVWLDHLLCKPVFSLTFYFIDWCYQNKRQWFKLCSSALWYRVVWYVGISVLEEHVASVIRVNVRRVPPDQRRTRFLHACSALCKCANWLCRTCTAHHTVAGRSSVSLTQSPFRLPLQLPNRPSPPQPPAGPFHPVHACKAQQHTLSHTVRCARLVHLCSRSLIFIWKTHSVTTQKTTVWALTAMKTWKRIWVVIPPFHVTRSEQLQCPWKSS
jgi:hypothetical protein